MTNPRPLLSVVMAHYRREEHLFRALFGYRHQHSPEELKDVEFVIIDDDGGRSKTFWKVIEYHSYALKIVAASMNEGTKNPSLPMNYGIKLASGKFVVLTNAENIPHTPRLLTELRGRLESFPNRYLSCGCYSLDAVNTAPFSDIDWTDKAQVCKMLGLIRFIQRPGARGKLGWFNHSKFRPAHFYFLTGMHRDKLVKLGGFDEDFARGQAFEDADLVQRVKKAKVEIKPADDIVCLHPHHYNSSLGRSPDRDVAVAINQSLFYKKNKQGLWQANKGKMWGKPRGKVRVKRWQDGLPLA